MLPHLEFLKQLEFFQGFTDAELGILLGVMRDRRPASGEKVCVQGQRGESCFIIAAGSIRATTERAGTTQLLGDLGPGSMFGELALVDGGPRSATCTAGPDTILLELCRSDFDQLCSSATAFGFKFCDHMTRTLVRNLRRAVAVLAEIGERLDTRPAPDDQSEDEELLAAVRPLH